MLPLRHEARWRLAGFALLLTVMAAAFMPALWYWSPPSDSMISDKLLHLLTFLFLSVWFSGQYARSNYWRLIVGLTALGALIELGQSMIYYRSAEWMDLVADTVGIFLGLVTAFAGLGGWSLRFEQWLEKAKATSD